MNKLLTILLTITCLGCSTPYFKSTQGTLTNVGVSLPSDQFLQFQLASYLSGDNIIVKDKSKIKYEWTTSETNNYFGIIKTMNNRHGKIAIDE